MFNNEETELSLRNRINFRNNCSGTIIIYVLPALKQHSQCVSIRFIFHFVITILSRKKNILTDSNVNNFCFLFFKKSVVFLLLTFLIIFIFVFCLFRFFVLAEASTRWNIHFEMKKIRLALD